MLRFVLLMMMLCAQTAIASNLNISYIHKKPEAGVEKKEVKNKKLFRLKQLPKIVGKELRLFRRELGEWGDARVNLIASDTHQNLRLSGIARGQRISETEPLRLSYEPNLSIPKERRAALLLFTVD